MNWLNSIDTILDRAFVPQNDDGSFSNNTGSSSIWSEGASSAGGTWEDEDEELASNASSIQTPSSSGMRVAVTMAMNGEEEDATELTMDGDIVDTVPTTTLSTQQQQQQQTPSNRVPRLQVSPAPSSLGILPGSAAKPGMIRPGKLRMTPKRQISSSSEEEDNGDAFVGSESKKAKQDPVGTPNKKMPTQQDGASSFDNDKARKSPKTNAQLLKPIPRAQEDSSLLSNSMSNDAQKQSPNRQDKLIQRIELTGTPANTLFKPQQLAATTFQSESTRGTSQLQQQHMPRQPTPTSQRLSAKNSGMLKPNALDEATDTNSEHDTQKSPLSLLRSPAVPSVLAGQGRNATQSSTTKDNSASQQINNTGSSTDPGIFKHISSASSWSAASSTGGNTDDDENEHTRDGAVHLPQKGEIQGNGLDKSVVESDFLQQAPAQSTREIQRRLDNASSEDEDIKCIKAELAELQMLVESVSSINEVAVPTQAQEDGNSEANTSDPPKLPTGFRLERTKTQPTSNVKETGQSTSKLLEVKRTEINDGEDTTLIESSTESSPAQDSRTSNGDDHKNDNLQITVDKGFDDGRGSKQYEAATNVVPSASVSVTTTRNMLTGDGHVDKGTIEAEENLPEADVDESESPSIDLRSFGKTTNEIPNTGAVIKKTHQRTDAAKLEKSGDNKEQNQLSSASLNFLDATTKPALQPPIVESENDEDKILQEKESSEANDRRKDAPFSPSSFEVDTFLKDWDYDLTALPHPINCYGAFHIRLLRAQRLPCPVGSTVHAIVSLLPWKGRFRTERKFSFLMEQSSKSSFDHGVCVQWDEKNQDAATISLVHAYASEATPIPTIKIQLMLSPVAMLEFSMCTLNLPCDTLMSMPGMWRRQWFLTEMQENKGDRSKQLFSDDHIAMVQVEAVFVPDDQYLGSSFVSINDNSLAGLGQGEIEEPAVEIRSSEVIEDADAEASSGSNVKMSASPGRPSDGDVGNAKKSHLLRIAKFWKPAACAVCSTSLMGWRTKSFRCEACGVDCCSDCFQHVDVQLPCGSDKAKEIVRKAIQNKLTVNRFLEAMAPVDESYEQKKRFHDASERGEDPLLLDAITEASSMSHVDKKRIGVLKLNVIRAWVFSASLPSVAEPSELVNSSVNLQPGDYYVRVCRTGTTDSVRTRTIPSAGKLKFEESHEIRLDVAHYGVDFFIEVVEAHSDKIVGTSVITSQGILQQQRDLMIEKGLMSVLTFVGRKPPAFKQKQRILLELRTGVRSGASSDFFVAADSKTEQGEISGWVELLAGLEEDIDRLYGHEPYACPAKPPDALHLNTLNLNISRIGDLVEDIANVFSGYQYMVSWRNPLLTGFSFVFLVSFCIKFNAEYVGSLPFLGLMLCMLRFAASRSVGRSKTRFEQEEAEEWMAAERDIDVKYTIHRPISTISIKVTRGKHIRSRETGLAGNVGCRVYWDPLRYANDKKKEKLLAIDKSTGTTHEIGCTDSKFTVNPTWGKIQESAESRRLKQVLPHRGHFFESEDEEKEHTDVEFPILQPFRKVEYDADDTHQHLNAALEPWSASPGAVVFQVHFRDILNMLPGSDQVFGEVAIPLSQIVKRREINGWFPILEVGTKAFVPNDDDDDGARGQLDGIISSSPAEKGVADAALTIIDDNPKIYLDVKWSPPEDTMNSSDALDTEREASMVIQEELLRWTAINRDKGKLRQLVVGGSIGAFKTVSGLAGTLQVIQNFLGSLVDKIESLRNALNFTDPYKSSMLLAIVGLLWLLLSLVPTRAIVLVAVVAQYALTLKSRVERYFAAQSDSDNMDSSSGHDDEDESEDLLVWLMNALRGLPTDEDLRKTYFWAGRRIGARKREMYANEKRMARLKRLWKAKWHATVKVKSSDNNNRNTNSAGKESWAWETVFALVQGRRFLWWRTVGDFDNGDTPLGRIFLAGHAGLCGLSPLEMREIDPKEVLLVTGIFGRGLKDQERLTILLPSEELKESLENAVIDAAIKDD